MSWTDYPALGERCYFLTLPNGLAVRVLPKPGFAEKFAFLGTNFGSDDVCFTWNGERHTVPDGTAHFLEHRMFSLPDCDPEDAFSRLGAQVNAFTDYAMTGYYFSCTEHFDDCLRLLLRMVMTPDFQRAAMASDRALRRLPCRLRARAAVPGALPPPPHPHPDHGHAHVHPPGDAGGFAAVL